MWQKLQPCESYQICPYIQSTHTNTAHSFAHSINIISIRIPSAKAIPCACVCECEKAPRIWESIQTIRWKRSYERLFRTVALLQSNRSVLRLQLFSIFCTLHILLGYVPYSSGIAFGFKYEFHNELHRIVNSNEIFLRLAYTFVLYVVSAP